MVIVTKVVAVAQDVRDRFLRLWRVQGTPFCAAVLVHGQNSDGMRRRSVVARLENAYAFVAHGIRECFFKRGLTNLIINEKKNKILISMTFVQYPSSKTTNNFD